jgi:ribosomal protein S18 acetylase RimI-like enzyme
VQPFEDLLINPTWNPLLTEHAHLAIGNDLARRYPADVLPFAGVPNAVPANLAALRDLLDPGEPIYLSAGISPEQFSELLSAVPDLVFEAEIPCWQMHFSQPIRLEPAAAETPVIRPLSAADGPAMVHLTDVAFPGLFRPRTYVLGRYFGIEIDGELIAMAGERFAVPGFVEISAVCTHPAHTGRGYAARLIKHVLLYHADGGVRSFLHVAQNNARAIALYDRLGFHRTRAVHVHRLRRV